MTDQTLTRLAGGVVGRAANVGRLLQLFPPTYARTPCRGPPVDDFRRFLHDMQLWLTSDENWSAVLGRRDANDDVLSAVVKARTADIPCRFVDAAPPLAAVIPGTARIPWDRKAAQAAATELGNQPVPAPVRRRQVRVTRALTRSEERRVGKECA